MVVMRVISDVLPTFDQLNLPRAIAQVTRVESGLIIVCGAMIYGLGWTNWMRLLIWLVIGLALYFSYGRRHSRLEATRDAVRA